MLIKLYILVFLVVTPCNPLHDVKTQEKNTHNSTEALQMDLTSLEVKQIHYFNLFKQDQDVHQSEYGGLCDYPP